MVKWITVVIFVICLLLAVLWAMPREIAWVYGFWKYAGEDQRKLRNTLNFTEDGKVIVNGEFACDYQSAWLDRISVRCHYATGDERSIHFQAQRRSQSTILVSSEGEAYERF